MNDPWLDDPQLDDAEAEYWEARERDWMPCGCKLCMCSILTEYGEPCIDCLCHAHQG